MPWYGYSLIVSGSTLLIFGTIGGLFVVRDIAQWLEKKAKVQRTLSGKTRTFS